MSNEEKDITEFFNEIKKIVDRDKSDGEIAKSVITLCLPESIRGEVLEDREGVYSKLAVGLLVAGQMKGIRMGLNYKGSGKVKE